MDHDVAIRATGIHAAYTRAPVLRGIDLTLEWGAVTALTGANGAGKSTLLEILAGARDPGSGTVIRAAPVALVVQRPLSPAQLPLTVADTVRIGASRPARHGRARRSRAEITAAVTSVLESVDLVDLAHRPFGELSGGQRQRALIAQGLATGDRILFLDEPAAGLDVASRERTRGILATAAERGIAVCCVTHDAADWASADRWLRLEGGRIAEDWATSRSTPRSTPHAARRERAA